MSIDNILTQINELFPAPVDAHPWLFTAKVGLYTFAVVVVLSACLIPFFGNRKSMQERRALSGSARRIDFFPFQTIMVGITVLSLLTAVFLLPLIADSSYEKEVDLYKRNVKAVLSNYASSLEGAVVFDGTPIDHFIKQDDRFACVGTVTGKDGKKYTFDFIDRRCLENNARGYVLYGSWFDGLSDLDIEEGWLYWRISKSPTGSGETL